MYHTYIDNKYTENQVKKMQFADSKSKTFHNVISQEQLKSLQNIIKKIKYPEIGKTSKYAGANFRDPLGQKIKEIFHEPLKKIIGEYDLDFYAWQEAINPWKVHADIRWYKDKLPYKVILFPLDVISDSDSWKDTYTIAFKQRNYLEGNRNTNEGNKGNSNQSDWIRPCEDKGTKNLCEGYKISKDEHEKYFSHMPYEFLEGLEIDNVFKWTPGSCVTWDQNQLHCADNFLTNDIKTKLSLIFFTNQKPDKLPTDV
jgi:hypothetical protein